MKSVDMNALRNLSPAELAQQQETLRKELSQLQLKSRMAGVEKPSEFRRLRRSIARLQTVQRERTS